MSRQRKVNLPVETWREILLLATCIPEEFADPHVRVRACIRDRRYVSWVDCTGWALIKVIECAISHFGPQLLSFEGP